jgi:superfamily II DNA or RNA helicase
LIAQPDMAMTTFTELFNQLDLDDNVRGKQFERICKWYLEHDPVYAGELRHVWLWKDWPDRWSDAEAGIDLVAQDRQGHLWAIQTKAYNPAYWVTKHDVDTFLSESNRRQFSFRLLIATTDLIGRTAKRTLEAQEKQASVLLLGDLEAVEVDWPASPSDLRARRLPPKKPTDRWAYQGEAVDKVIEGFQHADRGKLIMACGTGKTLVALFTKERLAAQRTLMLVPSLQLLKQTIGEWRRNRKVDFDYLPVCSDDTVSDADQDMPISTTSDLALPSETDPEEIARFLRRRSGPRVVFATYQSSPEIAEAFRLSRVPAFDLVIADEAHRCAAPHSSEFATILDNEKIRASRRLFMTATPRIYSARILKTATEAGFEYASMDDETQFGQVFHRLTFGEAIERNLLTDYQVAIIGVDNATYRDWAEKAWFITIDGREVTDARAVAGQIGLAKAMRRYDMRRVITFHSRVKGAQRFAQTLPEVIDWMPEQRPAGKLWTDSVDGTMSAGERQRRMARLRDLGNGDRGVISNARCLTEGIDVPTLDGVAFIDPKRSEIDIAQAVGRAIRRAPDKTIGTIVIPVFIDTDEPDPEVVLNDSAFKPVWDVLLALRAHDEELAQQLDDLRRMLGRRRSNNTRKDLSLPPKIKTDIPDVCGRDFARAFNVRLIERTTASWEFWFGLAEQFAEREGHCCVPQPYSIDGYRLGLWVNYQRFLHVKGILKADREHRLEALPGWTWNARDDKWEESFDRLVTYIKEYGHARVPVIYKVDGVALGEWVHTQRNFYREGTLGADRELRLQQLSGWTWDPSADQWTDGFSRLLKYVECHGDARVPQSYVIDGFRLGDWVIQQRSYHTRSRLERDRQHQLEDLPGWAWDRKSDKWEEGFRRLKQYVECHGNARVPKSCAVDGYPLGQWVAVQRRFFTDGRLDTDRQQRLEEMPGWMWNSKDDWWEENYSQLVEYSEKHGHARVPKSYTVNGYKLGMWVSTQRVVYRRGKLLPDRQRRLEELLGWTWDASADCGRRTPR